MTKPKGERKGRREKLPFEQVVTKLLQAPPISKAKANDNAKSKVNTAKK